MYNKFKDFQLTIVGILFFLAVVYGAIIVTSNLSKDNISVTGSAYEIVESNSASWTFRIETKNSDKSAAYKQLKAQNPMVIKYLKDNGIKEKQIEISAPTSYETYKTNPKTGYTTNDIAFYNFSQSVKISSNDVNKIKFISTDIQKLLEQNINVDSDTQPEYQYSKISDLKVKLLEKATKDAKNRAKSMLKSNHNKVGKIRSAQMGVFQITPVDSTSVSDSGINDLTSIEKKVTAVANVVFAIK